MPNCFAARERSRELDLRGREATRTRNTKPSLWPSRLRCVIAGAWPHRAGWKRKVSLQRSCAASWTRTTTPARRYNAWAIRSASPTMAPPTTKTSFDGAFSHSACFPCIWRAPAVRSRPAPIRPRAPPLPGAPGTPLSWPHVPRRRSPMSPSPQGGGRSLCRSVCPSSTHTSNIQVSMFLFCDSHDF